MTGIIFATRREAAPFLARAGVPDPAVPQEAAGAVARARAGASAATAPVAFFHDLRPTHALVVCICGMGPDRARAGTEQLLEKYAVTSVINAGAAGAVADDLPVGGLFHVSHAILWPDAAPAYACQTSFTGARHGAGGAAPSSRPTARKDGTPLPAVILATVATPVFDPVLRARIARHADIVDMEGAAIAQCCQARGVPLTLLKGVTDQAGAHDRQRLLQNLDAVSITLAAYIWQTRSAFVTHNATRAAEAGRTDAGGKTGGGR